MENDLKKLILCLKWDVDNIEDLNTKRAYLSDRISDIQELVKNCNIADVVGQSEQLEDFVKHLQNKYGVLLDQYTETIVEKYKSSN